MTEPQSQLLRHERGDIPVEELDGREWAAGMTFEAYGVRIRVRATDGEALHRLPDFLPYGWKQAEPPAVHRLYSLAVERDRALGEARGLHALYEDGERIATAPGLDAILESLERSVRLRVAEDAQDRIFVHAGVVGWRGKAVLIPGRSFAGKTTLVVELVRAGGTYYSDEYAVLDAHGRVHPFATPLQIREASGSPQRRCRVEELGGRTGQEPLPAGLVAITGYKPGARWRPRRLSPGRGLLELLDDTVVARTRPREAMAALAQVVSQAPVYKGMRGEARHAAPDLLARLDREASASSGGGA